MTQQEKINKLKELSIAYKCALEYDAVPRPNLGHSEEIFEIRNDINTSVPLLEEILEKYEGWKPSDIEDSVFKIIDTF